MRYNKYFNEKKKELNDTTILKDLKEASKEYEDGAILECRDNSSYTWSMITEWEVK